MSQLSTIFDILSKEEISLWRKRELPKESILFKQVCILAVKAEHKSHTQHVQCMHAFFAIRVKIPFPQHIIKLPNLLTGLDRNLFFFLKPSIIGIGDAIKIIRVFSKFL